ncbi:hypothetical protein PLESTB_000132100 [Pleodorina starrii]|uniref:Uncharacterized protein n=1 Tax=Pleodorina starrii TaxID=330485 RepID=A0A9W6BBJ7_9CHLO|nr:hypothetical protein PLESTB_000132100 [Pleodorina starrii]
MPPTSPGTAALLGDLYGNTEPGGGVPDLASAAAPEPGPQGQAEAATAAAAAAAVAAEGPSRTGGGGAWEAGRGNDAVPPPRGVIFGDGGRPAEFSGGGGGEAAAAGSGSHLGVVAGSRSGFRSCRQAGEVLPLLRDALSSSCPQVRGGGGESGAKINKDIYI